MNVWNKAIEYIQDNVTFLPPEVLINYLESKYILTEKNELSLRSIDKYKDAFDNDYNTDTKVSIENGFSAKQLTKAKFEFWNSKELDEDITLNSFQGVQRHFLNWCRRNKERIKDVKNNPVKAIQPTIKQIAIEVEMERPKYAESEAELLWKESMQSQFITFKEKGILNPLSATRQYKMFVERELITDDFSLYEKQATEIILSQKSQARITPTSKYHRDSLNDAIKRISEGKPSSMDRSEIEQQAKLLSIENFYKTINELKL